MKSAVLEGEYAALAATEVDTELIFCAHLISSKYVQYFHVNIMFEVKYKEQKYILLCLKCILTREWMKFSS